MKNTCGAFALVGILVGALALGAARQTLSASSSHGTVPARSVATCDSAIVSTNSGC